MHSSSFIQQELSLYDNYIDFTPVTIHACVHLIGCRTQHDCEESTRSTERATILCQRRNSPWLSMRWVSYVGRKKPITPILFFAWRRIGLRCYHPWLSFRLLYGRKFSSAKNFVKSDCRALRQEFIFVKRRPSLVCSSVVRFCEKISQDFNLVKKLLWRKRRN